MPDKKQITYRKANSSDLRAVIDFVDFWLAGRAKSKGIKNGGNDYFVTRNQHQSYIRNAIVRVGKKENIDLMVKRTDG